MKIVTNLLCDFNFHPSNVKNDAYGKSLFTAEPANILGYAVQYYSNSVIMW